ncbi:MAG: S9 family peptidase, partial [Halioglobus sp.]|nr:S9 family peptidase [Halioglobus sp.]
MTTQLKPSASGQALLTNEAIFKDWSYSAKRPGTVRWADLGATYTALEIAPGYEDAVLEKDENGNDIKIYQEVVQYDPVSGNRKVLISLQDLTPK